MVAGDDVEPPSQPFALAPDTLAVVLDLSAEPSQQREKISGIAGKVVDSNWRRGSESNRRIKVLQTSPLPLGYRALMLN